MFRHSDHAQLEFTPSESEVSDAVELVARGHAIPQDQASPLHFDPVNGTALLHEEESVM